MASETAGLVHGGNLSGARLAFPGAPEPWIDLSTGINPHSYPHSPLPSTAFSRLPEPVHTERLKELAGRTWNASSAAHVVAGPGTQMLLPLVAALGTGGAGRRAAILSPTYAEHARAARMAGFSVDEVTDFARLFDADLAVVVNPNNPDGRLVAPADLLALAAHMAAKGGLLVIDEAFMEVGPEGASLTRHAGMPGLVILRSFGKFYGMAGLRLGFALGVPEMMAKLAAQLGPWAVSGPALHVACEALADDAWRMAMRERLSQEAEELDAVLLCHGLQIVGGTGLFRLVRNERAAEIFNRLGESGILVRAFAERPQDLRFGLPADAASLARLNAALMTLLA